MVTNATHTRAQLGLSTRLPPKMSQMPPIANLAAALTGKCASPPLKKSNVLPTSLVTESLMLAIKSKKVEALLLQSSFSWHLGSLRRLQSYMPSSAIAAPRKTDRRKIATLTITTNQHDMIESFLN